MTKKRIDRDELIPCACKCGQNINKYDKRGRTKKFIKGHQSRGITRSEDNKNKIRNSLKGRFIGNKHPKWKGDDIDYSTMHKWIRRHLPKPEYCEICGIREPTEVANFNGKYLREFIYWWWLCMPCHREYDSRRCLKII